MICCWCCSLIRHYRAIISHEYASGTSSIKGSTEDGEDAGVIRLVIDRDDYDYDYEGKAGCLAISAERGPGRS
jgi:hypothetical protein